MTNDTQIDENPTRKRNLEFITKALETIEHLPAFTEDSIGHNLSLVEVGELWNPRVRAFNLVYAAGIVRGNPDLFVYGTSRVESGGAFTQAIKIDEDFIYRKVGDIPQNMPW